MSTPSFLAQPQVQPLRQLIAEVTKGQILIPRFQRPFVWKDQQRLSLLDSINRGIPIGSLMVWRTSSIDLGVYEQLGPFELRPTPRQGVRSYLLDGHQRLSTLYGALAGENVRTHEFEDDVRWPIFFDLEDDESGAFRLPSRRKGWSAPDTWLPLSTLLDPVALYEFQKRLLANERVLLARKAEHIANRFKDYPIPVVPLVTEDLELVTTTFRRINSQGTTMSEAHMLSAIMWARGFDLHRELESIVEHAESVGWASLDIQSVVDMLKAVTGQEFYKARLETMAELLRKDTGLLERLRDAIIYAVRFLAERCLIRGMRALPYKYQLVALVVAAYEVGEFVGDAAVRMEQWVWRTTYSELFTGISSGRLRYEIAEIVELAAPEEMIWTWEYEVRPLGSYRRGTVRGTAFELQLGRLRPLDMSGKELPAAELLANSAKSPTSTIIPKDRRQTDDPYWADRLVEPPNFVLLPVEQVTELRQKLAHFDPDDASSRAILESHAITEEAARAYAKGDLERFLHLREASLIDEERRFVAETLGMEYLD